MAPLFVTPMRSWSFLGGTNSLIMSEHVTSNLGYTEIPELVPNLMGLVLSDAFIL
jgi:hypothetical protein